MCRPQQLPPVSGSSFRVLISPSYHSSGPYGGVTPTYCHITASNRTILIQTAAIAYTLRLSTRLKDRHHCPSWERVRVAVAALMQVSGQVSGIPIILTQRWTHVTRF